MSTFDPRALPMEVGPYVLGMWKHLRDTKLPERRRYGPVVWNHAPQILNSDWTLSNPSFVFALRKMGFEVNNNDVGHDSIRYWFTHATAEMVHAGHLTPIPGGTKEFYLTLHGIRCLEADDPTFPLDTTGRVEVLRSEFAGAPDLDLMCRYLSEAVEAYRHGLTLASATMIGCAYELALVQLATAVVWKWPPGAVPTITGQLKDAAKKHAAGEYAQAGMLADVVYKSLEGGARNGEVTGTINAHLHGLHLWVALRPPVEDHL